MTYLMTPKVTVIFVVGLTLFMTPKVTGSLEVALTYFMTPKVIDLCGRFDLVYDQKRSQDH